MNISLAQDGKEILAYSPETEKEDNSEMTKCIFRCLVNQNFVSSNSCVFQVDLMEKHMMLPTIQTKLARLNESEMWVSNYHY